MAECIRDQSILTTQKTQAERDAEAAKQQGVAIRLECLKMAVSLGSAADVRAGAELYEDFIVNGAQPAPAEDVPPA
jgi:hypothetical protein